jgi:hypothetical protein
MGPLRTALDYVDYPAVGYPVATARQLEQGFAILVGGDGFGKTSIDHPDNLVWLENVLGYYLDEVSRQREVFSPPPGADGQVAPEAAVRELLARGESETVEFKERGRFDDPPNGRDEASRMLVKTVAAFLNSRGGTLLIGVSDDGTATGLGRDYETLSKSNADGFVLWLMETLDHWIDTPVAEFCRASVVPIDGEEVCKVTVAPAPGPVFARDRRRDAYRVFWHRRGNASVALEGAELVQYTQLHWRA